MGDTIVSKVSSSVEKKIKKHVTVICEKGKKNHSVKLWGPRGCRFNLMNLSCPKGYRGKQLRASVCHYSMQLKQKNQQKNEK